MSIEKGTASLPEVWTIYDQNSFAGINIANSYVKFLI